MPDSSVPIPAVLKKSINITGLQPAQKAAAIATQKETTQKAVDALNAAKKTGKDSLEAWNSSITNATGKGTFISSSAVPVATTILEKALKVTESPVEKEADLSKTVSTGTPYLQQALKSSTVDSVPSTLQSIIPNTGLSDKTLMIVGGVLLLFILLRK